MLCFISNALFQIVEVKQTKEVLSKHNASDNTEPFFLN